MPWLLAPAAGAGLIILGLLSLYPLRRQRRLLMEGRPSAGIVTEHKKQDKETVIHYKFHLLSGAVVKGHSSAGKEPAPVGSLLCVLYDPENPRSYALYPLSLVRLFSRPYMPR